jgi:hypothetical protein
LKSNASYLKYQEIAQTICNSEYVSEIVDFSISLQGWSVKTEASTPPPFVFCEASSGIGKTQAALAIRYAFGHRQSEKKALYLVTLVDWEKAQSIYATFINLSRMFMACAAKDLAELKVKSNGVDPSLSPSNMETYMLYTFGFLHWFVENGYEAKDVPAYISKSAREKVTMGKISVALLDEFVTTRDKDLSRFIRNVFRAVEIPVVLLGTDSRAANLIGPHESSRTEVQFPWCRVFIKFPKYILPPEVNEIVGNLLENSRPLFSSLAAPFFTGNAPPDVNTLTRACRHIYDYVTESKMLFVRQGGRDGQVCLFDAGSYKGQPATEETFPTSVIARMKNAILIHRHFAGLDSASHCIQLDSELCLMELDLTRKTPSKRWRAESIFPDVGNDILLYLSCMGNVECPAFAISGENSVTIKKRITFSNALKSTFENSEAGNSVSGRNPEQSTNDGMMLEFILTGAVCAASHNEGFAGSSVPEFLKNLIYELSNTSLEKPSPLIVGLTGEYLVIKVLIC